MWSRRSRRSLEKNLGNLNYDAQHEIPDLSNSLLRWPTVSSTVRKERKGKEEYLYSAFLHQGTHKAKRSGMDHTVLPANNTMHCLPFLRGVHQMSPPQQLRQQTSNCSSLLVDTRAIHIVTFRVSRRRREMYCGYARLCVCLSVRGRMPTLLNGPGCNLGEW